MNSLGKWTLTAPCRFVREETGATAIEYALVSTLIAAALVATASNLGFAVSNVFFTLAEQLLKPKL